jgi:hypothetical protein
MTLRNDTEKRIKKYGLFQKTPEDIKYGLFFCTVKKKLCPGSKCLKHRHWCCEEGS